MVTFKKMRIYVILVLVFGVAFTSCTTDEYDLSKGLNTDMTIGGDSLTIPIGKTERILLGSLLNGQSLDILKKSENGDYSFYIKDSTQVKIDSIPRVSFTIAAISIPPITSSFGDNTKIPPFSIDPINITTSLSSLPTIDLTGFSIDPINMPYTKSMTFSAPSGVKRQSNIAVSRSKSSDTVYGPFRFQAVNTINESLSYDFPTELNSINTVDLKDGEVTLTFDKSEITNLGVFSQQLDTIKSFKIEFPAEFRLSLPTNHIPEISIEGSTIVITGAALSGDNGGIFTTTFTIERLENMNGYKLLNLDGTSKINYIKPINYSIDYVLWGSASDLSFVGKSANIKINLTSAPKIEDLNISTTDINVTDPINPSLPLSGFFDITQTIAIPADISKVQTITFNDGANLAIKIDDLNAIIDPLMTNSPSTSLCEIDLPKKFIFKPASGLDLSTNILKLPYDQLFGQTINIGISGMKIDQDVQNNSITINDALTYSMNGLTVVSKSSGIWVSNINNMKTKEIGIQGTISPLTVSNASVETKSISFAIPEQSPVIHIDQNVSDKIQNIYSIALKNSSKIQFSIEVSDLPPTLDRVYFRNYTIQFPSFLKFKAGDLNDKNQLVLGDSTLLQNPDYISLTNGAGKYTSKELNIEAIDFGENGHPLTNGNFKLDESVSMKGSAYILGANLNSTDLSEVHIQPVVTIGSMTVGQIEAQMLSNIIPSSASDPKSIKLDLPSFLTDKSTVLDIVNPVMQLIIGNSMGIGLKLPLILTPYKNNSPQSDGIININKIAIAPAPVIGQTNWKSYWISNLGIGASAGYDTINVPLSNLLKSVPDRIDISAIPQIDGTRQKIDLYSPKNQIDIKYSVNVPLSFGQNFSMQYIDTIGGLKDQLAQILKNTQQVDIIATVENSIPLELSFGVTALNSSRGAIDGVTISASNKINAGNVDGTAQKTKITISLTESSTEKGALQLLDALKLVISANSNSTVAGLPLKADQYIALELRVKIPNGITINPSSNK